MFPPATLEKDPAGQEIHVRSSRLLDVPPGHAAHASSISEKKNPGRHSGRGFLNLDKGTAPENKRRSPAPGCQSHRAESRTPPDIKDEGTTYVMLLNNVQL